MDYRERLLNEYEEIVVRLYSLRKFLNENKVEKEMLELMEKQFEVMFEYKNILHKRLCLELGIEEEINQVYKEKE